MEIDDLYVCVYIVAVSLAIGSFLLIKVPTEISGYICCGTKNMFRFTSQLYWILFPILVGLEPVGKGIPYTWPFLLWLFMLVESCFSSEFEYITNAKWTSEISQYLVELKAAWPVVGVQVECYHTENDFGEYPNDVTTYTNKENFPFVKWMDCSAEPGPLKKLVRIRIEVEPGDSKTEQEVETRVNYVKYTNRFRDEKVRAYPVYDTEPHYARRFMVGEGARVWWIGIVPFCVCSVLAMGWPYRWVLRRNTSKFIAKKKFFTSNIEQLTLRNY